MVSMEHCGTLSNLLGPDQQSMITVVKGYCSNSCNIACTNRCTTRVGFGPIVASTVYELLASRVQQHKITFANELKRFGNAFVLTHGMLFTAATGQCTHSERTVTPPVYFGVGVHFLTLDFHTLFSCHPSHLNIGIFRLKMDCYPLLLEIIYILPCRSYKLSVSF